MSFNNSQKRALLEIRKNPGITKVHLAEKLQLSFAKISGMISDFQKQHLVQTSPGVSTGGRRPSIITFREDAVYTLGVDIGTQFIRAAVVDASGGLLSRVKLNRSEGLKTEIPLPALTDLMDRAVADSAVSKDCIEAVGIGITGVVDETDQVCLFLHHVPSWENYPLSSKVSQATGYDTVRIFDSVKAVTIAESRYGAGRDLDYFVLVNVGMGLGAGIMIDGELLESARGPIGEIGHIFVGEDDGHCCCGNTSCLESVASGWAMVRKCEAAVSQGVVSKLKPSRPDIGIDLQQILDAARDGDKLSINLINETIRYLSIGCSTIVNLLNPQTIVLAGGLVTGVGEMLLDSLLRETRSRALPWLHESINFKKAEFGEFDGALGAALIAGDTALKKRLWNNS